MKRLTAKRVRKLRAEVAEIRAIRLRDVLIELPREVEISGEIPTTTEVTR